MPETDNEMTDREFLGHLAGELSEFITVTRKQLDHLDEMAHDTDRKVSEISAFIEEHRPALARGLALMGGGLGGWIGKRKGQTDG